MFFTAQYKENLHELASPSDTIFLRDTAHDIDQVT